MKRALMVVIVVCQVLFGLIAYAAEDKAPQESSDTKESKTAEGTKETAAVPETKLGEVVVTATRTEKTMENVPGDVHVVTKEDIEKQNIKTVDEALTTTPGVFDNRGKGLMATTTNISIRGIPGANRTLIMMDGIQLNNAYTGDVMWGGLPVDNVEKIEVVEGPFSSLYGGNAMGGVVNILTKMPEKQEITLKSGYGSSWNRGEAMDDLRREYVSYGNKFFDKLSIFVSYGYDATNGYPDAFVTTTSAPTAGITGWTPTTDYSGNKKYIIGNYGDNTWWDDAITAKASYDFSKDSKLTASFTRTRYEYNYDPPQTYLQNAAGQPVYSYGKSVTQATFLGSAGNGGMEQNMYALTYETEVSGVRAKVNAGLVDQTGNWYTTPGSTSATALGGGPGQISSTPSKNYFTDAQFTFPLFNFNVVTLGGTFNYAKADTQQTNLSDWQDKTSKTNLTYAAGGKGYTYSVFAQDEVAILKNLTAYAGLRQDWWTTEDGYANSVGFAGYPQSYASRSDSAFSPKFSLVYKPFEETTFRSSVGKAFSAPTIYDLYRTWTSSTGVKYVSNPNLDPETSTSWDISAEQGLWKGARVKATFFENFIDNLIYRKTVSATEQDYVNAGKATIKGVTAEIEQKFDKWLKLYANATFTNGKINANSTNPISVGKDIINEPTKMFNIGAEAQQGHFLESLVGHYVAKRFSTDNNTDTVNGVYGSYDPYFLLNGKITYKLFEKEKTAALLKQVALSFSVDNILDRHYFAYYEAPGRSWFTDLTIKF